jgi:hypothetical protein
MLGMNPAVVFAGISIDDTCQVLQLIIILQRLHFCTWLFVAAVSSAVCNSGLADAAGASLERERRHQHLTACTVQRVFNLCPCLFGGASSLVLLPLFLSLYSAVLPPGGLECCET